MLIKFHGSPMKLFYHEIFSTFSYIIEITVHVLPIMSCYWATATSSLVLQRYLSAIRFHTRSIQTPSKTQSSVTRPLQRQCYSGIAIGDKNSCESHSQLIKYCESLNFHVYQWLQLTMNPVSFCWMIATDLGLHGFTLRQTAITQF